MSERNNRQSFLGIDSEQILDDARLAIVGLGGGGSHVAQQVAHVGIGNVTLFDPDAAEDSNLNRLIGATAADIAAATKKVTIAERLILAVKPDARVNAIASDWRDAFDLLHDADIIVGCLDSFRARFELESLARRYLIPYLDLGMDVHAHGERFTIAGQVALSLPGKPCLRCMGLIGDADLARERYGVAGGRPQVVWPNGLLASAAVGLVVQMLTPWCEPLAPALLRLDGDRHTMTHDPWLQQYRDRTCQHFEGTGLGDPFFGLREA